MKKTSKFLTHEEHFQAHCGNWKNDANGRFNLKTKSVDSFDGELPRVNYRKLSDPISDRSKKIASTKYERIKAISKARKTQNTKRTMLPVKKTRFNNSSNKIAASRNLFISRANANSNVKTGTTNVSQKDTARSMVLNNGMGN